MTRREEFEIKYVGGRTREQLAEELYGIYLSLRANCDLISEEDPEDPWPEGLHLADVLDKYVLPNLKE